MSVDDRMRQAHRAQSEDVRRRVDVDARAIGFEQPPSRSGRLMVSAAAVTLLAVGGVVAVRSLDDRTGPLVEVEAGSVEESTTVTTTAEPTETVTTETGSAPSVPATGTAPSEGPATSSGQEQPDPTAPEATADESIADGEVSETTGTAQAQPVDGVTNAVCPTGYRAELETARLRYLGENRGWGRLDDLVDEQDGPFYFEAWEPGYPDPVTVEVSLVDPVVATDIRVAQDPFTPVDGSIFIGVAGREISIELDGTEGWRVHRFEQPTVVDRFTIRRQAVTSNIMEVLVCVEAPG